MTPGSVIGGKYRLEKLIARGSFGSVWRAKHEALGRAVAVKCIHTEKTPEDRVIERFNLEARIAASIQHRFVIDIFDFGQTETGEPYMVMELLRGKSLGERLVRGPVMEVEELLSHTAKSLRGLQAAHLSGIVHRDLKPENIFLVDDVDGSYPKLLDFGISRIVGPNVSEEKTGRLTKEGTILGTPYYMSPEQVRGRENLDQRTDVYSMGVILYEGLTGAMPFASDTIGDLLIKIATEEPAMAYELRSEIGLNLSDLVAKAMAPNPEDRFQTAEEMRHAIEALEFRGSGLMTVVSSGGAFLTIDTQDQDPDESDVFEGEVDPSVAALDSTNGIEGSDTMPATTPPEIALASTLPSGAIRRPSLTGAKLRRWGFMVAVMIFVVIGAFTGIALLGGDGETAEGRSEPAVDRVPSNPPSVPAAEPMVTSETPSTPRPVEPTEPQQQTSPADEVEPPADAGPVLVPIAPERAEAIRQRRATKSSRPVTKSAPQRSSDSEVNEEAPTKVDAQKRTTPQAFRDPGW